jgi:hypothetical protein
MIVRRMSALPPVFFRDLPSVRRVKSPWNAANRDAPFSPKAKVRGSNPFGRANDINDLIGTSFRRFWRGLV